MWCPLGASYIPSSILLALTQCQSSYHTRRSSAFSTWEHATYISISLRAQTFWFEIFNSKCVLVNAWSLLIAYCDHMQLDWTPSRHTQNNNSPRDEPDGLLSVCPQQIIIFVIVFVSVGRPKTNPPWWDNFNVLSFVSNGSKLAEISNFDQAQIGCWWPNYSHFRENQKKI